MVKCPIAQQDSTTYPQKERDRDRDREREIERKAQIKYHLRSLRNLNTFMSAVQ
jgi:hypothetical protein